MEYMNLNAAMKLLGINSYTTLKTYIAAGLPVIQVGKSKRISKTAIDKFMAEHQSSTIKGDK
ncbi:hypothetical protein LMUP508_01427 [Limosilactobacillus mucosae]|uniref:DNA-binding protein n=2 Tax=Limosilactobacillus mucosae TaxID=97478 RepID=A0A508YPN4_LIMMU|nr:hypothetical protein LMUP508_01427 [Limosilactobacillus mucosae]